ncbi:zinc finger protein [Fragilaria crotonensis]|nr:zinc finger protein [Fragilaria crotonensis]
MRNAAMGNIPAPASNDWASQAARPASGRTQAPSFAHSSAGSSMNRQSDLGQDNFPSLGGASHTRASYPSFPSNSASRSSTTTQNVPSITASDFPSLGAASKTRATYPVNANVGNRIEARAPPLNNSVHFPPPPKVSSKKNSNLTKQFAADEIAPEAYVDRAAALFDSGYGDSDFWHFLPALLISCPNQTSAGQALRYVDDLRSAHQASTAPSPTTSWTAPPPLSASSGNLSTNPASAYQRSSVPPPPRAAIRPVGMAIQPITSLPVPNGAQGNSKGAWGNTGASSVVRAKASPVSVAVAAANQNPQNGTATTYMAKESRLQSQRNHATKPSPGIPGGGQNKKKKKQSAELRSLAFGK